MKILLVNYEYTLTGATLILLNLAEHLRASGHDMAVSAAVGDPGPIKQSYQERGFTVLDQVTPAGFDLAICNTVLTAQQVLELSEAIKTLWWIHEGSVGLDILLKRPALIQAFAKASMVVFPIAHLRDTIYRSFIYAQEPARFEIIPYGLPPMRITPATRAPSEEFRIVSVGSIYPRKRHADLVRAMPLFQNASAKCILVGKFYSLPDDCMRIIDANPAHFWLTGEIDNSAVHELLATADVFCLPSDSEVLPLTTLEAGMLERPMVLSDLSVYEGIWRHGVNCLLHPAGAVGMLAQSIAMLAQNSELCLRLGAAAHRTASYYTEGAFFSRFDAVLATLNS